MHGQGLDELTLAGETQVCEWQDGRLQRFTVTPDQAGLAGAPISAIAGGDAAHERGRLRALLQGETGPYRDTVLLNAAAALIVAGRAADLAGGVAGGRRARRALRPCVRGDRRLATWLMPIPTRITRRRSPIPRASSDACRPPVARPSAAGLDARTTTDVLARICADTRAEVDRGARPATDRRAEIAIADSGTSRAASARR